METSRRDRDETDSVTSHLAKVKLKLVEQKIQNERNKLMNRTPTPESTNDMENQARLQQAMQRRQELLDRIRREQIMNESQRPRTYTPRQRYTPSPGLPPPSRRSLPDFVRYQQGNQTYRSNAGDRDQVRHVIEHKFEKPSQPQQQQQQYLPPVNGGQTFRPPVIVQPPAPPPPPQIMQAPPAPPPIVIPQQQQQPAIIYAQPNNPSVVNLGGGGGGNDNGKGRMFDRNELGDQMLYQNATMHQMVMQKMMIGQFQKDDDKGSSRCSSHRGCHDGCHDGCGHGHHGHHGCGHGHGCGCGGGGCGGGWGGWGGYGWGGYQKPGGVHHHHYSSPPPSQPAVHHYTTMPQMDVAPAYGGGQPPGVSPRPDLQQATPRSNVIKVPIYMKRPQPKVPIVQVPQRPIALPKPQKPVSPIKKTRRLKPRSALWRFRYVALALLFLERTKISLRKKVQNRPSSVFLFGIILKEIVAALHKIYLNPNGNIYPVLCDIIGPNCYDLSALIHGPVKDKQEEGVLIQELQYVLENVVYHITEIMPSTGVLGTHRRSAVAELVRNGKRFPEGYFWNVEMERMQFSEQGRTVNIGEYEAFLLIVGIFISRSMVTTLLMKPQDYGLSSTGLSDIAERNLRVVASALLYLVRRITMSRSEGMMPMPQEIGKYLYDDSEMQHIYGQLARTFNYCEGLLREWGAEYIKRLRANYV